SPDAPRHAVHEARPGGHSRSVQRMAGCAASATRAGDRSGRRARLKQISKLRTRDVLQRPVAATPTKLPQDRYRDLRAQFLGRSPPARSLRESAFLLLLLPCVHEMPAYRLEATTVRKRPKRSQGQ